MEGQQFCLRWHNFQNTLLSTLPKLLDGGYLTDVTLSAGGRHIRAHRIILSACSYYFKELFKDLSTLQHPVIVLPGMEYSNLCALVTFMYNGEVNIYQEQLPALLAMADTLHIRGLADIAGKNSHHDNGLFIHPTIPNDDPEVPNETTIKEEKLESSNSTLGSSITSTLNTSNTSTKSTKSDILDSVSQLLPNQLADDDLLNDNPPDVPCSVKTKPYYSINAKLAQRERKQQQLTNYQNGPHAKDISNYNNDDAVNDDQNITIDDIKNNVISDSNLRFLTTSTASAAAVAAVASGRTNQNCNKTSVTCLICGKQLSNQYNLRVHMETHSNSSYSCTACSHVSRSRDALRKHVSYRHPVATPQKRPRYSLNKPENFV
ncbi:GSCOCG00013523001-RA-CDS [Cotesia congregata]|uniref:Similar to bab2: Protein bric-a-brac 2 (Drosophila melanogaster) n=1 Tax=Cotesia congregata TaxID=51543 RepID=A0A8J2H0F2_COTCN|nr:GSCOCG00013523001-RA-CDS [Cotesia congregata]CAG5076011.1 Similar to bab2: Protein bric-a-brac 2 (Drosophila melanogaster) [Cotesia congregata]